MSDNYPPYNRDNDPQIGGGNGGYGPEISRSAPMTATLTDEELAAKLAHEEHRLHDDYNAADVSEARRVMREVIAELRRHRSSPSSAWRDIKDAPKDGTKVDLLYQYPRGRTINCYWAEAPYFCWVRREPTWEGLELLPEEKWRTAMYPNMEPTHWRETPEMPLPKVTDEVAD